MGARRRGVHENREVGTRELAEGGWGMRRPRIWLEVLFFSSAMLLFAPAGVAASMDDAALKVRADAYVAGSWNGIFFVVDDQTGFQVRVGTRTEGGDYLDGDHINPFLTGLEELFDENAKKKRASYPGRTLARFYESVTEVGPHAPDGSYSRLAWNPIFPYDTGSRLRLEWSRVDATSVLAKLTYVAPVNYMSESRNSDIVLEAYSPIGFQGEYQSESGAVTGHSQYWPVLWQGDWNQWKFFFSSDEVGASHEGEAGYESGLWKSTADDASWKTVRWGAYWQEDPFLDKKGYGWYRTQVVIPAKLKGTTLRLLLGKVREHDWTYFNGELIGETRGSDVTRAYAISPGTPAYGKIRWGEANVIAVQVFSASELGGISSGPYGRTPGMIAVRVNPPEHPRLQALGAAQKTVNFVLASNRRVDQSASYQKIGELQNQMQQKWELGPSTGSQAAGLLFYGLRTENMRSPRDNELYFVAKVGTESPEVLLSQCRALLQRPDLGDLLEVARERYEAGRVAALGGLSEATEMISDTLNWAVLYSREQGRRFVVDSRRWFLPDSWSLFGNSAVLTAWPAAMEDKSLGEDTLKGILIERLPDGRVMNGAGAVITTPDRSEDMYASYAAWKIYQKWGDKDFLREMYPLIKGWHEWWFADRGDGQPWRDGNRDGLLELGCNMSPFNAPQSPPDTEDYGTHHQGAMWESGYDDSPMWGYYDKGPSVHPERYRGEKGVQYLYRTGTLNLNVTMTNALWALSADMLVRIAHELGYAQDEQHFREEYDGIKKRINDVLWDDKTGMYLNRFWPEAGGGFSYRKSPVMFYMMAAGVPSPAQARRLVYEHMLNPREFWGEYVLPSISRDDPAYPEQYYWRGTIWPPMNYFTYEGLKRYGFDDVAAQLAEKTFRLVRKNWDSTGALWENYNSITGEGDSHGAGGSTKHYSWSAALPLMAIMECIDTEAWGEGLRFGSLGLSERSRVLHWQIRDADYDVTTGPDITELRRNNQRVFYAPSEMIVRDYAVRPDRVFFRYKTHGKSNDFLCLLGGLSSDLKGKVSIRLDSEKALAGVMSGTDLALTLPTGEHSVEVRIPSP
jgi:hypothetical protein